MVSETDYLLALRKIDTLEAMPEGQPGRAEALTRLDALCNEFEAALKAAGVAAPAPGETSTAGPFPDDVAHHDAQHAVMVDMTKEPVLPVRELSCPHCYGRITL